MSSRRTFGPQTKHRATPYGASPPTDIKSMSNSERGKYYRRRRKLYGAHLEERVAELREEIQTLTISRQVQQELALSQRCTPVGAAARIVDEYCLLFQHGAPVRLAVDKQDASASLVAQSTIAQRGFLNAVMTENVRFGEFLGVELVLAQWERYSLFHAALEWTMKSLDVIQLAEPREVTAENRHDDGPLVVAIFATLRVRFSRRTIEEVFPHLLGDEALMQSLIGLEIEWYAVEADYAGALLTALKDPELVARIMGHAVIVRGHMIGDEDDGRQLAIIEDGKVAAVRASSPAASEDSIVVAPDNNSSYCGSNKRRGDHAAVVSDDELECSPNRLELSYILDD